MSSYGPAGYTVIGPGGARYGPVDAATLRSWVAQGRVVAGTPIEDPISGHVSAAATMPELSDLFSGASAAPPGFASAAQGYASPAAPFASHGMPMHSPVAPYHGIGFVTPPKSKVVAILLALFLGGLGVHRFYLGHSGTGTAMLLITLLSCGFAWPITGIWALVDLILIATGGLTEHGGRPLA